MHRIASRLDEVVSTVIAFEARSGSRLQTEDTKIHVPRAPDTGCKLQHATMATPRSPALADLSGGHQSWASPLPAWAPPTILALDGSVRSMQRLQARTNR